MFGVKKNQEILGFNQGAMTNNYPKETIKSDLPCQYPK